MGCTEAPALAPTTTPLNYNLFSLRGPTIQSVLKSLGSRWFFIAALTVSRNGQSKRPEPCQSVSMVYADGALQHSPWEKTRRHNRACVTVNTRDFVDEGFKAREPAEWRALRMDRNARSIMFKYINIFIIFMDFPEATLWDTRSGASKKTASDVLLLTLCELLESGRLQFETLLPLAETPSRRRLWQEGQKGLSKPRGGQVLLCALHTLLSVSQCPTDYRPCFCCKSQERTLPELRYSPLASIQF